MDINKNCDIAKTNFALLLVKVVLKSFIMVAISSKSSDSKPGLSVSVLAPKNGVLAAIK